MVTRLLAHIPDEVSPLIYTEKLKSFSSSKNLTFRFIIPIILFAGAHILQLILLNFSLQSTITHIFHFLVIYHLLPVFNE